MPRRLLPLAVLAVLLFAGCDASDPDAPDAEVILGTWTATSFQDEGGDLTDELDALGTLQITFAEGDAFTLAFDPADGETASIAGTYLLNETTTALVLRAEVPELQGQTISVPTTYRLQGDDRLEISIEQTYTLVIGTILGADAPDFEGDLDLAFERD